MFFVICFANLILMFVFVSSDNRKTAFIEVGKLELW